MGRFSLWLLVLVLCPTPASAQRCDDAPKVAPKAVAKPVRVTVVVVAASTDDSETNPKLATLAVEVQKRNDEFIGFKIVAAFAQSIPIGENHTFDLPEKQTAKVTVSEGQDKDGHVELTIKLPGLDDVTYTCVCNKFFPIVTPYKLKTGETILVAILAKPCTGK